MSETNDAIQEDLEDRHISKGLIFTAIVLFPLVPFALIYLNRKMNKKLRAVLMIAWFIVLTATYQFACMYDGPVVKSVSTPVSTITAKVGTTQKINYTILPNSKKLKIKKLDVTSSDRSKATVENNNKVRLTSAGKCTITIRVIDNHYTERKKKITLLIID